MRFQYSSKGKGQFWAMRPEADLYSADELRASKIMADRAFANDKIEFAWNSEVVDVLGDDKVGRH